MTDCEHCGARLPAGAKWCGLCLEPVAPAAQTGLRHARGGEEFTKPVYSRWKGGPTSFGPAVKIAITIFVLAMAPVGGLLQFRALWAISYVPIAALVLWGTWRRQQVT